MSDAYRVVIESNDPLVNARIEVVADTTQSLHDRLTAVVDGAVFTIIGAATSCLREEIQAQRNLGAQLDARPVDPPKVEQPKPEAKPQVTPTPEGDPWGAPPADGPALPAPSASAPPAQSPPAQVAPPQQGNFPPAPKWMKN